MNIPPCEQLSKLSHCFPEFMKILLPRHEVARTSLRSFIGPILDGDFDISDVDCLFCICGNPRRAKPSGTPGRE